MPLTATSIAGGSPIPNRLGSLIDLTAGVIVAYSFNWNGFNWSGF